MNTVRWTVVVGLLITLLGCGQPTDSAAPQIVFAVTGKPASLHPILATDALSERIAALLYRPLVAFDGRQKPVPGVIRWQQRDEQHYLIRMNSELTPFSDGSLPMLSDVLATIRSAMTLPGSPHAGTLAHIASIEPIGDSSLLVALSRPDPRFPEKLHLGLFPAKYANKAKALARAPVGSGSFEWVTWHDNGVLLKRRRDGLLVRFESVPDPTMRALKLIRGEAHLTQNDLPGEIVAYLADEPLLQRFSTPGSTFSYLGFNLTDPVTGDLRVRKAIAHAIDREAIVHHLFKQQAAPTQTLLTRRHWAAAQELPAYRHDPEAAKALLESLGHGPDNPLVISYKTSTDPFRVRIATVLQAQLKAVGIDLRIQSYEWGTFFGDIKEGRFQMYGLSWVGIRSPDIFRHIYHSDAQPPAGANRGRLRSARIDDLIDRADQLPASDAAALYQQLQRLAHQQLVYVPLWHENQQLVVRGLNEVRPDAEGSYRFLEQVSLRNGQTRAH